MLCVLLGFLFCCSSYFGLFVLCRSRQDGWTLTIACSELTETKCTSSMKFWISLCTMKVLPWIHATVTRWSDCFINSASGRERCGIESQQTPVLYWAGSGFRRFGRGAIRESSMNFFLTTIFLDCKCGPVPRKKRKGVENMTR